MTICYLAKYEGGGEAHYGIDAAQADFRAADSHREDVVDRGVLEPKRHAG
jgi:hypothetical protein